MDFSEIKGFGEKRIADLKAAGINDPADLITYFPRSYIDLRHLTRLSEAQEGERVVIIACTRETPKVARIRRTLSVVKVKFIYDDAAVWCSWFNQPFMAKKIVPGRYYIITGKLKRHARTYEIVAPQLIKFTGEEPAVIAQYKPLGKVSSALISEAIGAALDAVRPDSYIPAGLAMKYGLTEIGSALRKVHFPESMEEAETARRTLSLERLAYMLSAYSLIRSGEDDRREHIYKDRRDKLNEAIARLPYSLTSAQKRCLDAIISGFGSPRRVNVLIEGDVGCGKTVVAFLAMYYAALGGHQSAMMAPTEILAYQHYVKAEEFFRPLGIKCAYLSGAMPRRARDEAAYAIASGEADIAIGTHALIGDDVEFCDLSLVITDEQHRFGVAQRAKLESKASGADSIVMSATPIPRTLALTLYGDLDRLVIDELPAAKAKITTRYVPAAKEEGLWRYIAGRSEAGERTFVVVPRISEDEDETVTAEALYKRYAREFGSKIALLHGKMKDATKNETMAAFAAGDITVLVATTVVEVGIDVPDATTIVIYEADRFGLAQLHQLRGRVGRGEKDSYCFVLSRSTSPDTLARLERFITCSDGFELAEYDFRSRGAGDFLGYDQHGSGGFPTDPETIAVARALSAELIADDGARMKIAASVGDDKYEFFAGLTLN